MINKKINLVIAGIIIAGILFLLYELFFGAPQIIRAKEEIFVVPLKLKESEVIDKLKSEGFIKSESGFNFVLSIRGLHAKIKPGGYEISKSMNAWQAAGALENIYLKWIVIPEGWRKEEIAELLAKTLGWDKKTKDEWLVKWTAIKSDEIEGVYFPDTYLLPQDESPEKIAERLRVRFQEKFVPYYKESSKENIKWDTLLKIASLIQREAAGKEDMPLISGIIWNRLLKGIKLDIDATLQYSRDTAAAYGKDQKHYLGLDKWWQPITNKDKEIDSAFNTYRFSGLPPHPIDNPGIDAIAAALHPAKTDCLYYFHDKNSQTYCSKTYQEHQEKIKRYLK